MAAKKYNCEVRVEPLLSTDLPGLPVVGRGKVRDIYALGERLLIVTTDRLSAFDVVFNEGIPGKGAALTRISVFWFDHFADRFPNHLITSDIDEIAALAADAGADLGAHVEALRERTMLVKKLKMLPVECVARGFLVGSGWKDYQATGAVCGIDLPAGLQLCDRLPEPIFTPATKAEQGEHDENISFERAAEIVGQDTAETLRAMTLGIFSEAQDYAKSRGIIIADTKLEIGLDAAGDFVIGDELLTPDSSRFWPADEYAVGRNQPSFDKQIVRDYLETLDWNKQPPPPPLPAEIIEKTAAKYREVIDRLIG